MKTESQLYRDRKRDTFKKPQYQGKFQDKFLYISRL